MTAYRLRLASEPDAEAICRIYNQGIVDRVATLETELRTPDERRQWLASRDARHPVIVAELVETPSAEPKPANGLSADPEPGRAYLRPPSVQAGLTAPATTAEPARAYLRPPSVQAGLTAPATTVYSRLV